MNSNVNSTAKIVKDVPVNEYTLGTFNSGIPIESQNEAMKNVATLNDRAINGNVDPLLIEVQKLTQQMAQLQSQVQNIENNGIQGRDLDKQVVQALKDLKNYATFFEKATFQLEEKVLKTSMSIAKKIIGVEIGEQSAQIAKVTIENMLGKLKTASQITIHLNPKDFTMLKDQLNLDDFIKLEEDANVSPGGVVIASDLGNFDGNVDAKVQTIIESLDIVV